MRINSADIEPAKILIASGTKTNGEPIKLFVIVHFDVIEDGGETITYELASGSSIKHIMYLPAACAAFNEETYK